MSAALWPQLPAELQRSLRATRPSEVARLQATNWCRAELAGRLVQLTGRGDSAALTMAFALVVDAQREGEPCAWISARGESAYPPDVAACGVDLAALPVLRLPGVAAAARAAVHLLRSGGFGLVVVDLGAEARVPAAALARLMGLVQRHACALVFLCDGGEEASSLGSLISLRAHAQRRALGEGRFECRVLVTKDKRRGPGWSHREVCHGPAGLR